MKTVTQALRDAEPCASIEPRGTELQNKAGSDVMLAKERLGVVGGRWIAETRCHVKVAHIARLNQRLSTKLFASHETADSSKMSESEGES